MSESRGDELEDGAQHSALQKLRREFERHGFRPSRRRGQNFLLDPSAARAIVRDARVASGDCVLEVGPGPGALTEPLVQAGVRLIAVEIEERLLAIARARIEGHGPSGESGPEPVWILGDVLESKHRLAPEVEAALPTRGAWHLVSNLPYSVSAPLLAVLALRDHPPLSMTVLVQREVADRLCSQPGTRAYGALTVALGVAFRVELLRDLPPRVFWPRPKIQSSLLRFEARSDRPPPAEARQIVALARGLLQHRRKSLGRVLSERMGDRAAALSLLASLRLDARERAEGLSVQAFRELALALEAC